VTQRPNQVDVTAVPRNEIRSGRHILDPAGDQTVKCHDLVAHRQQ